MCVFCRIFYCFLRKDKFRPLPCGSGLSSKSFILFAGLQVFGRIEIRAVFHIFKMQMRAFPRLKGWRTHCADGLSRADFAAFFYVNLFKPRIELLDSVTVGEYNHSTHGIVHKALLDLACESGLDFRSLWGHNVDAIVCEPHIQRSVVH